MGGDTLSAQCADPGETPVFSASLGASRGEDLPPHPWCLAHSKCLLNVDGMTGAE